MFDLVIETLHSLVSTGKSYLFLLPIYAGLLLGERIAHAVLKPREVWDNREAAANIVITVAVLGLNFLVGHVLPLAVFAIIFEGLSLCSLGHGYGGWLSAFVLYDLAWYVDHRIAHRTGLFWAMHHVHHSSPVYNMTVASRGFLVDTTLLSRPTFYLLPFLGLSPMHFMVISIATNIWGIAQHTRLVGKLPWLDWLLATPSNHRVHHGVEAKYLDRNYGETLMIWDQLLGTYQREDEEPMYGVTEPIDTHNPLRIQIAGIQGLIRKMSLASSARDKVRCLFRPPEWRPAVTPH